MNRQRRIGVVSIAAAVCLAAALVATAWIGGLRVNITASEPLGLWRIVPLDRPVAIGDIVFVCPPNTDVMGEARVRGYLHSGLCNGAFAPLIKTVIALEGQRVVVTDHVAVDGVAIAASDVVDHDGQHRPLKPAQSIVLPAGTIFLHSDFVGSWDSRYFGPIPVSGVMGLAREVLTYAP